MDAHITTLLARIQPKNHVQQESLSMDLPSIINNLGGLQNVIKLCLTHTESNEQFCQNAISSINSLLNQADNNNNVNINTDTNANCINTANTTNTTNTTDKTNRKQCSNCNLHCSATSIQTSVATKKNIIAVDFTPISNATKPKTSLFSQSVCDQFELDNIIVARNPKDFEESSIVFYANTCNNLYFKWLDYEKANKCMNFVLLNKWFVITMVTMCGILFCASEALKISMTVDINSALYLLLKVLFGICSIIIFTSLASAMNFGIIFLIFHTFDFWFKIWNLLLWQISFAWINFQTTNRSILDLIMTMVSVMIGFTVTFLVDAIPLKYRLKRIGTAIVAFVCLIGLILTYFTYDNLFVNPFAEQSGNINDNNSDNSNGDYSFQHSKISVKSVFLGAYSNLIIFICKPILGDLAKWLQNKWKYNCSCYATDEYDIDDMDSPAVRRLTTLSETQALERLVSIYKQPRLKWNKNGDEANMDDSVYFKLDG